MAAPCGPITHLTRQRCTMQKEGGGGYKVGRRVRRKKKKIFLVLFGHHLLLLENKIKLDCAQSAVASKI